MCFVSKIIIKMIKKRNAQGLSITTIIIAVIGLVVIVVLIAVFTGRLAWFGQGLDKSQTCENVCTSIAKKTDTTLTASGCVDAPGRRISGTFSDVPTNKVCCCT